MTEAETKALMNFDNRDEVESTFVDDGSPDITDESVYEENRWPKELGQLFFCHPYIFVIRGKNVPGLINLYIENVIFSEKFIKI